MNATQLLTKQHRKVETLFKRLESGRGDADTLTELANDLVAHMAIEQDIFYPAVRSIDGDLVAESLEEHSLAELGLKRLLATDLEDDTFKAKVTTVKELILHHVKEEEEDLFPEVEKKLGEEKLEALGKEMKAAFDAALEQGYEALLPKGMNKTSADQSKKATPHKAPTKPGRAA